MEFINQFESHYDYDCSYMRRMAETSPKAFEAFVNFLPMGKIGSSVPSDILWTAKIASMLTEDCGSCVQLSIKMAIEAGVEKDLVKKIVLHRNELSPEHSLMFKFATSIATNGQDHQELQLAVAQKYGPEQLTELAVAISSTKIYPTIKRALGEFKSCSLYEFEF